jgi:membrane carboxypeptidase/penicillin-binding protein
MDQTSSKKPVQLSLTGASSALPIWVSFMKNALRGEATAPFPPSPFINDVKVDLHSGKEANSDCPVSQVVLEKYIRGHEPRDKACETGWPTSSPQVVNQ